MTTATDLLPLPEGDAAWYYIGSTHVYSADEMESYARANVANAVAPLQAEIEALRAEVERVTCELMDAITRADKLAEALRWAERHCPCGARPESPNTHPHVPGCPIGAALHPTAAQEDDDA